MLLYKITDSESKSRNNTIWKENVLHAIYGQEDPILCSSNCFHAYTSIEKALVLNSIHGDVKNPILWEVDGHVTVEAWDQVGCWSIYVNRKIPLPEWYTDTQKREDVYRKFMHTLSLQAITKIKLLRSEFSSLEGISNVDDYLSYLSTMNGGLIAGSNSFIKESANQSFRKFLHLLYEFYERARANKDWQAIADSAFVIYIDIYCKRCHPSPYYNHHIGTIYETSHILGIDCDTILKQSVEAF